MAVLRYFTAVRQSFMAVAKDLRTFTAVLGPKKYGRSMQKYGRFAQNNRKPSKAEKKQSFVVQNSIIAGKSCSMKAQLYNFRARRISFQEIWGQSLSNPR